MTSQRGNPARCSAVTGGIRPVMLPVVFRAHHALWPTHINAPGHAAPNHWSPGSASRAAAVLIARATAAGGSPAETLHPRPRDPGQYASAESHVLRDSAARATRLARSTLSSH